MLDMLHLLLAYPTLPTTAARCFNEKYWLLCNYQVHQIQEKMNLLRHIKNERHDNNCVLIRGLAGKNYQYNLHFLRSKTKSTNNRWDTIAIMLLDAYSVMTTIEKLLNTNNNFEGTWRRLTSWLRTQETTDHKFQILSISFGDLSWKGPTRCEVSLDESERSG